MGLSFKDAARLEAILERHLGNKAKVALLLQEIAEKRIGGKKSQQAWKRVLDLVKEGTTRS